MKQTNYVIMETPIMTIDSLVISLAPWLGIIGIAIKFMIDYTTIKNKMETLIEWRSSLIGEHSDLMKKIAIMEHDIVSNVTEADNNIATLSNRINVLESKLDVMNQNIIKICGKMEINL